MNRPIGFDAPVIRATDRMLSQGSAAWTTPRPAAKKRRPLVSRDALVAACKVTGGAALTIVSLSWIAVFMAM